MTRNKEYRRYLYISIAITLVAIVSLYPFHRMASIIVGLLGACLITLYTLYTRKRYEDIAELSQYLRRIMDGDYNLDIRSNEEGELSILRNEIFKLTIRLHEQHDYLSEDRQRMASALADISHQLKTPLTSMQMMVDLLEDESLSGERRQQFLGNIQSQLERMNWLVKVLLKLSKLDAGTVQFNKQRIELDSIVKRAVKAVQVNIYTKNIDLRIPQEGAPIIYGDEQWLLEAISNVIKNAVDHTPTAGAISIAYDENPIVKTLTIHNSGLAIDKQDLPNLFKRFYKGRRASDASVGIGLSLSLQIMEAHNGTIEVHSTQNEGTSFTFKWYLPK